MTRLRPPSGTSGSGASLAPTATKTAAYTAAVGDLAMMNVAGGATALTLPTAPADKAQVAYRAIGATTAVPLVVTAGAGDTIGTTGATTASIVLADETVVLQYQATGARWISVSNVKTQTSLDARYGPLVGGTAKLPAHRRPTTIVNFGVAGHGWTANSGTSSSNVNDTTDFVRGTQSAKITSKGDGTVAAVRNTAMTSINLTGKAFEVSIKVDDWTHVANVMLYVGDTAFANFRVIYLWKNTSASGGALGPITPGENGEWVTLTADLSSVEATTGTPNIAAVTSMQVAIQDDNTGNTVTLHTNHVAHFPAANSNFPNGLLTFTFDDSFATHYTVARPALDKYGFKGTFYTIIDALGTTSCATLAQLKTMHNAGHEIALHATTRAVHNAVGGVTALDAAGLDAEMRGMRDWAVSNGFRGGRDHYAYPQGFRNQLAEQAVGAHLSSARFTLDRPLETSNPAHPLRLRTSRLNTPKTLASAQTDVDNAYANGGWLIFTIHDLPPTTPSGSNFVEWQASNFTSIVDYVATKGIPVLTIGAALASL